jgi:hypothetical protein
LVTDKIGGVKSKDMGNAVGEHQGSYTGIVGLLALDTVLNRQLSPTGGYIGRFGERRENSIDVSEVGLYVSGVQAIAVHFGRASTDYPIFYDDLSTGTYLVVLDYQSINSANALGITWAVGVAPPQEDIGVYKIFHSPRGGS